MKQKTGRSFITAFSGLCYFFLHEKNGRIQAIICVCTLILAVLFNISSLKWIAVLLCSGSVLCLEMLNSALEKLADIVEPAFHPHIKILKDVAAGGVLLASIISAIIGTIIFLPEILRYL